MERIPSDPEERERILKRRMQSQGLPFIGAPPMSSTPYICPECDAGDPTNIITTCDCNVD